MTILFFLHTYSTDNRNPYLTRETRHTQSQESLNLDHLSDAPRRELKTNAIVFG